MKKGVCGLKVREGKCRMGASTSGLFSYVVCDVYEYSQEGFKNQ